MSQKVTTIGSYLPILKNTAASETQMWATSDQLNIRFIVLYHKRWHRCDTLIGATKAVPFSHKRNLNPNRRRTYRRMRLTARITRWPHNALRFDCATLSKPPNVTTADPTWILLAGKSEGVHVISNVSNYPRGPLSKWKLGISGGDTLCLFLFVLPSVRHSSGKTTGHPY